ncbi:MAG: gamma carbonic anhydrase family protein [Candidatus Palauibacterales bacterium]|jgi:carbonic anhydrase/acetyltransferase-like protein (isoleucine patch superfamily)|nr:gamma carbonic anhydrase family protein [Candidatus Palauibacterales bacterium]
MTGAARPAGGADAGERLEYVTAAAPSVHPTAWIAPGAVVRGDVTLGSDSSVWYQCVLRGDIAPIRIGAGTNIQDLSMVHVDVDRPCHVGDRVGIGHRAIIHACDIEDGCLIGMGAIVLSNAVIGAGSVIAAGAVVLEGMRVPPDSLVAGVPGRVIRSVDEELRRRARLTVEHYRDLKEGHRTGRWTEPGPSPSGEVR